MIWAKMRTAAQETTPQILLQTRSGGRSIYKILVKGEFSAIKRLLYKRFSTSYEDLTSS